MIKDWFVRVIYNIKLTVNTSIYYTIFSTFLGIYIVLLGLPFLGLFVMMLSIIISTGVLKLYISDSTLHRLYGCTAKPFDSYKFLLTGEQFINSENIDEEVEDYSTLYYLHFKCSYCNQRLIQKTPNEFENYYTEKEKMREKWKII